MRKKALPYFVVIIGILVLGTGLVLLKSVANPHGVMLALPYVCIGLGCGAFGHGLGNLVRDRAFKNDPELQKKMEIDQKDERNIAISNRAKAKAYDIMLYIFGAVMVSFVLAGVEVVAILLLVAAYLLIIGVFIFYLSKYGKEM